MKSVEADVNFIWEVCGGGGCHGSSSAGRNGGDFRDISFPPYVVFPAMYRIFTHHIGFVDGVMTYFLFIHEVGEYWIFRLGVSYKGTS